VSAQGEWNLWFYLVPIGIFGPLLATIFYQFAIKNIIIMIKEERASKKEIKTDDYVDARKRRGFV
jgi:hypothetical protein